MVIERTSVRVLLVSPDDDVLLTEWHDPAEPDTWHWIPPGGAVEPGEEPRDAAVRELVEETGIVADPAALIGPLATQDEPFSWAGRDYLSHESYFALASRRDVEVHFEGLEPLEVGHVRAADWWTPEALRTAGTAANARLPEVMELAVAAVQHAVQQDLQHDAQPRRRVTARVIPVCDTGEVLLLQELDPAVMDSARWGTVGGAVDAGESLDQAAVRELYEETGLRIDPDELSPAFHRAERLFTWNGDTHLGDSTFFALRLDRDVPIKFDHLVPEEVDTVLRAEWWRPEDLAGRTDLVWPDLSEIAAAAVRIVASGGRS